MQEIKKVFLNNLTIYSLNFLIILFTYFFIKIVNENLNPNEFFLFTGFVAILNIFTIPLNALSISLSSLTKQEHNRHSNNLITFFLIIISFFSILVLILYNILDLERILKINKFHFLLLSILITTYSIYVIIISKFLNSKNFFLFSINNFLPFFFRIILFYIFFEYFSFINFNMIIIIYLLSHIYAFKNIKTYNLNKKFFSNIFFLQKKFVNNFVSIIIISIILNLDILLSRSIDLYGSNKYYLESLFGKVALLTSLFISPYIYKMSFSAKNNFVFPVFMNILLNVFIFLTYFYFFDLLNSLLFPSLLLDSKIVLKVTIFSSIFALSYNISTRLNIYTIKHSYLKFIILFIFLIWIMIYPINNFDKLLEVFLFISLTFLFSDIINYVLTSKKLDF